MDADLLQRVREKLVRRRAGFLLGFTIGLASIVGVSFVAFAGGTGNLSGDTATTADANPMTVSAAGAMSVFAQPRTSADVFPSSLADFLGQFEPSNSIAEELRPGTPDTGTSHRLLHDVGPNHADVYVVQTSKGRVCFVVTSGPYGGCFETFGGDSPVAYTVTDADQNYAGQPSEIFGFAPDRVGSVDVVEGGTAYAADLQNNALYYRLKGGTTYPQAIIVTYHDGTTNRMDIPALKSQ
jgi:hypothetical protein